MQNKTKRTFKKENVTPAVINYRLGERVVFRDAPHTASFHAMYVVRTDNNAAWITQENSDRSERMILACTNKNRSSLSQTTVAADMQVSRSTTDIADIT